MGTSKVAPQSKWEARSSVPRQPHGAVPGENESSAPALPTHTQEWDSSPRWLHTGWTGLSGGLIWVGCCLCSG